MLTDTTDYAAWLTDERRHRLTRMAAALQRDLMSTDGIGPDMRAAALERINLWLTEANEVNPHG